MSSFSSIATRSEVLSHSFLCQNEVELWSLQLVWCTGHFLVHFILTPSSLCVTLYPSSEAQYHQLRGICKQSRLGLVYDVNRSNKFVYWYMHVINDSVPKICCLLRMKCFCVWLDSYWSSEAQYHWLRGICCSVRSAQRPKKLPHSKSTYYEGHVLLGACMWLLIQSQKLAVYFKCQPCWGQQHNKTVHWL